MNTTIESKLPIVSLSLNPAIDLSYEVDNLTHDQKSRSITTCYDPGGTGINVGRALESLNANSRTFCVTAGKMGEFLRSLLNQELKNIYTLEIEGETRINTTLIQKNPLRQYEINAAGPSIDPEKLDEIITQFLKHCGHGIGILTGSLPPETPDSTYFDINNKLKGQGGRSIIDAPFNVLKKSLESDPFLIKPNQYELEVLQNKTLNSIEEIATESRIINQRGTTYVCVSLAEKGAILTGPENSYYCVSPPVNIHSTVGAGDSLVAGLAYAFAQNKKPDQALKFAVSCGAGTAKQPGTKLFNVEDLQGLSNQITVKTLDI